MGKSCTSNAGDESSHGEHDEHAITCFAVWLQTADIVFAWGATRLRSVDKKRRRLHSSQVIKTKRLVIKVDLKKKCKRMT